MTIRFVLKTLVTTLAGLALCAGQARAETYFNPWAGVYFGSNQSATDKGLASFGAAIGDTGHTVGGEINIGYSPDFFGKDTHVLDVMGGLTAGPMIGGRSVYSVKPYFAGGVGLLRSSVAANATNNFGFNMGGGVLIYFSTHLGIRGEARYFRTVNGTDLGDFHFTRAQFGLLIR